MERGAGYPEITQLVSLSEIFGVPVDTLMKSEKSGIAIAGNMLTDFVKLVNVYPEKGMLANVISISRAVGGCVPNTIIANELYYSMTPVILKLSYLYLVTKNTSEDN